MVDRRGRHVLRATAGLLVLALLLGLSRLTWTSLDGDGDGLSDCRERAGLRTSSTAPAWRTDPDDPDTDGDGVVDGEEVVEREPQSRIQGLLGLLSCRA